MRADSAEETSSPTTVLALVKAPLAREPLARSCSGVGMLALLVPALVPVVGAGAGLGEELPPVAVGGAPMDTMVLLPLAEEVLSLFLLALEDVVMVVLPAVRGNLPLEPSVVFGEEDISLQS